jgi:hypothetical protein
VNIIDSVKNDIMLLNEKYAIKAEDKYNFGEERIEDICVADADILSHFDNIPMLFNVIMNNVWSKKSSANLTLPELRSKMKDSFEYDFNDLSEKTKHDFKDRYNLIYKIVLGC